MVYIYIRKDLPNGHKAVRSGTEEGNVWLVRVLKLAIKEAKDNLALDSNIPDLPQ